MKGCHECPIFAVSVGEKFIITKKKGDPVLKVTDNGRGQLGHLQREMVPVLACFPVLIVNLSIFNHLNNKYLVNSGLIEIFCFQTASNTY